MVIGDISYGLGSILSFGPANFLSGLWTSPVILGGLFFITIIGAIWLRAQLNVI